LDISLPDMHARVPLVVVTGFALAVSLRLVPVVSAQVIVNGCASCHAALPDAALAAPVSAGAGDVHAQNGIRCADCHGGNATADDKARAHDPAQRYRGAPGNGAICATCHSAFAERYAVSAHAQLFTCSECHGHHGVQPASDSLLGTSGDAVCVTCHEGAADAGVTAAGAMRSRIDRLRQAIETSSALLGRVRNAGMEVGDQELALDGARTRLIVARMEIHASSPATLDPIVDEGVALAAAVDRAGQQAADDLGFRRRGLFVALGLILLVVVALTLKIRDVDRRRS
jgi:predicted CXXCH cytochrome family protein